MIEFTLEISNWNFGNQLTINSKNTINVKVRVLNNKVCDIIYSMEVYENAKKENN